MATQPNHEDFLIMINIDYNLNDMTEYAKNIRMQYSSDALEILFIMTSECNFRCTYCYEHKSPEKLKLESAKFMIDKLFSIEDNLDYWNGFFGDKLSKKYITFDFFGGECLLEIDNMDAICDYFIEKCNSNIELYADRKKYFNIRIQTNGSLLQTPKVKLFLDKWQNNINELFITTDGCQKAHDACRIFKDTKKPTYEIVKNNIMFIREKYPKFVITTKGTITPQNVKYLYESYLAYQDLGFKNIKTNIAVGIGWDSASLEILKKEYEKISEDLLENHLFDDIYFTTFDIDYYANRCQFESTYMMGCGTCGTNGIQIAITPRDEYCTCHLFAYLSQPTDETFKIGDVYTGISNDGMNHVEQIARFVTPNYATDNKCIQCSTHSACARCPGSAFMQYNDGTNNLNDLLLYNHDVLECEAARIEGIARLKYNYKKESILCNKDLRESRLKSE